MLKMDIPKIKPDGLTKTLQEQLNKKQKHIFDEMKQLQKERKDQTSKLQIKKKHTYVDKKAKSSTISPEKQMKETSPSKKAEILDETDQSFYSQQKNKLPQAPKNRSVSLAQMVENSDKNERAKIFQDSKRDRDNILSLQCIPKIRNKLQSLKQKDRFQQSALEEAEKLTHRRTSKTLKETHFKTLDNRPMSIADSEIQKINDTSILIQEASRISLQPLQVNTRNIIGMNSVINSMRAAKKEISPIKSTETVQHI